MHILGMRDLKSLGILPVKRAYIKIDLNMLKRKGQEKKKMRIYKTIPKETGPNPNIGTIISYVTTTIANSSSKDSP